MGEDFDNDVFSLYIFLDIRDKEINKTTKLIFRNVSHDVERGTSR